MIKKGLFNIIAKRIMLFIALPLLTGLIALLASIYFIKPVYEANTTLYIINKTQEGQVPLVYDDVLVGQQLVKDYKELIKSRAVIKSVISLLNITDLSYEKLAKKISVESKNDTRILEITVQDGSAERARVLADKISEEFSNKVIYLMKAENVKFVDRAEIPLKPSSPKPVINLLIGLLTGLMGAIGIVFAIEYMDTTIKTLEDVESYLGLQVLGIIPLIKGNQGEVK